MSGKLANIDVSARHVADMSPTFPTEVTVIGLKSIGATIPNLIAGNRGGSGTAQKAANANTKKGFGCFSQLNPLIAAQNAMNANNQKGLWRSSQLNSLVKLRLRPARWTRRA